MLYPTLLLGSLVAALPPCTAASGAANEALRHAADVMGMTRTNERVLRIPATDNIVHDYESDRPYPPYLVQDTRFTEWFDPRSGADYVATDGGMIGGYSFPGGPATLGSRLASYVVRDTGLVPSTSLHRQLVTTRPLNAWAIIADWAASNDARVVQRCEQRDFPRLALSLPGAFGDERLFLDEKTGFPVELVRVEPHYLWGQVRVEYVYATWARVDGVRVPGTATRMVDGRPELTRTFGQMSLVSRDSAPALGLPPHESAMKAEVATFLAQTAPDTIRVSPCTVLLRNPGYQETVTLARDTVFVFDATQGEERARRDSAWIGRLFPGKRAIAVVVTDLAWPHIAGIRYWVATGATIISHRTSQAFLERVIAARWLRAPDLLERRRASVRAMRFRAVDDSLRVGGGAITLFAIDGIASEGALGAFVHADRFLWASDFVQTLEQPTEYLDEVAAAIRRRALAPIKFAAEHLPLNDWANAERLVSQPD